MSDERRDYGETVPERVVREDELDQKVEETADTLDLEREARADRLRQEREAKADQLEYKREGRAQDLDQEREHRAERLVKTTRGKWRIDLVLVAALLVLVTGSSFWVLSTSAQRARNAVVNGLERNCNDDHEFREQYKLRGEAEKKLLTLFLSLAQEQVAAGGPGTATSKKFIKEFAPLTEDITIIPLPDCEQQADDLRDAVFD